MPRSPYRQPTIRNGLQIKWTGLNYLPNTEYQTVINGDLIMSINAMIFVMFYICWHCWSIMVGFFGVLQIILSLGTGYFIYYFIFGIPVFQQMNTLAIFLVLGVGADDIFVICDSWKQSRLAVFYMVGKESRHEYLERRVAYAYSRTASAVFNTSFTTALAFVCTGISPLAPISAFGWYSSICIVVNYIF